jgi:hypothetical protein
LDQVCLEGCSFGRCKCCPQNRKYILVIARERRNPERLFCLGIILDKLGPDVFVRSSKRLIRLKGNHISGWWTSKTRQRSIYLLTEASYSTLVPTYYPLPLEIKGRPEDDLDIVEAMPEARWNSSTRCWYIQTDALWGMVSLRFSSPPHSSICILFESNRDRVSIFDSFMYEKEIGLVSHSTSQLQLRDVEAIFGHGEFFYKLQPTMAFKDLALKVTASRGTAERSRRGGLPNGDPALKVWTEGNRSHSHVQPVLY